jgi:hypothetical protein
MTVVDVTVPSEVQVTVEVTENDVTVIPELQTVIVQPSSPVEVDIDVQELVVDVDTVIPGPEGPPGPPGPAGGHFVYDQVAPATSWGPITHGLGGYPAVTVKDSAGTTVEGTIDYVDLNNVTLSFNAPFSGIATLVL